MEEGEGFADGVGRGVGSEDFSAAFAGVSGEHNPRELFVGDDDVGVGLVVAETDVVGRSVLLNQVAFEDEGFDFAVDDDPFDVADFGDETVDADAVFGGGSEVASDAGAEVDGFPDVQDVPGLVFIDVTAGFGGELLELFFYVGICRLEGHRTSEVILLRRCMMVPWTGNGHLLVW